MPPCYQDKWNNPDHKPSIEHEMHIKFLASFPGKVSPLPTRSISPATKTKGHQATLLGSDLTKSAERPNCLERAPASPKRFAMSLPSLLQTKKTARETKKETTSGIDLLGSAMTHLHMWIGGSLQGVSLTCQKVLQKLPISWPPQLHPRANKCFLRFHVVFHLARM